jgi:hypothetical protein
LCGQAWDIFDSENCMVTFNDKTEYDNYLWAGCQEEGDWEIVRTPNDFPEGYKIGDWKKGGFSRSEPSGIDQDSWDVLPDKSNPSNVSTNGCPNDSSNSASKRN